MHFQGRRREIVSSGTYLQIYYFFYLSHILCAYVHAGALGIGSTTQYPSRARLVKPCLVRASYMNTSTSTNTRMDIRTTHPSMNTISQELTPSKRLPKLSIEIDLKHRDIPT